MNYLKGLLCVLVVFVATQINGGVVLAQFGCSGQSNMNCLCNGDLDECEIEICVNDNSYTVTVYFCTQLPTTGFIMNPCAWPTCARPLDAITWIKKICVPSALTTVAVDVIYSAILAEIDLCENDCLVSGVSFPNCDVNTNACTTSSGIYCYSVALPKCVSWNGDCLEACNVNSCTQFCFAEWQYCMDGDECTKCEVGICSFPNGIPCPGQCITVNCGNLSFDNNCGH